MSRTIKFAKAGGPEVLEFVEVQVPAPGPNEIRIKVKAIGINRAEAMWRGDDYFAPVQTFPAGLWSEASGIVDAVGEVVSGVAVGEEVDLVGEVMRITNGQGARVAFDPVGGPGFPKLISALAFGGIIYIYGLLGAGVTPLPVLEMIAKVATIKAHNMSLTSGDETRRKAAIEFVTKGLQAGALKPVIDRTFTFDEMADGRRYLEQSRHG